MEGVKVLTVATDNPGDGHYTDHPSEHETVAPQILSKVRIFPAQIIIHNGACHAEQHHEGLRVTTRVQPEELRRSQVQENKGVPRILFTVRTPEC